MINKIIAFIISLCLVVPAFAADGPISGLPEATSVNSGDLFYLVCLTCGGGTKDRKIQATTLADYMKSQLGLALDLANNGFDESTALKRINTTGDTNSIFTETPADELLIDVSKSWPFADAATSATSASTAGALSTDPTDCDPEKFVYAMDADGTLYCDKPPSGAPTTVDYIVKTADAGLSAERVLTDTGTITWDWATAGQAKATAVDVTCTDCLGATEIDESGTLDGIGSTRGSMLSRGASGWIATTPGTAGYVWMSNGSGADPSWQTQSALSNVAPYGQYDPDNPPATCDTCDEFTSGTTLTYSWGNQGGASYTTANGRLIITSATETTFQVRGIYVTAPSGSWTASAKLNCNVLGNNYRNCGISTIYSGTLVAMTGMFVCDMQERLSSPTGRYYALEANNTSYTASGALANISAIQPFVYSQDAYFQIRYDATADTLACLFSLNGVDFVDLGATDLTGVTTDPGYVGMEIGNFDSTSSYEVGSYAFFRVRTDANRNLVGE